MKLDLSVRKKHTQQNKELQTERGAEEEGVRPVSVRESVHIVVGSTRILRLTSSERNSGAESDPECVGQAGRDKKRGGVAGRRHRRDTQRPLSASPVPRRAESGTSDGLGSRPITAPTCAQDPRAINALGASSFSARVGRGRGQGRAKSALLRRPTLGVFPKGLTHRATSPSVLRRHAHSHSPTAERHRGVDCADGVVTGSGMPWEESEVGDEPWRSRVASDVKRSPARKDRLTSSSSVRPRPVDPTTALPQPFAGNIAARITTRQAREQQRESPGHVRVSTPAEQRQEARESVRGKGRPPTKCLPVGLGSNKTHARVLARRLRRALAEPAAAGARQDGAARCLEQQGSTAAVATPCRHHMRPTTPLSDPYVRRFPSCNVRPKSAVDDARWGDNWGVGERQAMAKSTNAASRSESRSNCAMETQAHWDREQSLRQLPGWLDADDIVIW